MRMCATLLNPVFAACAAALFLSAPVSAASEYLDNLYAELADPDNPEWRRVQADILREWSKSGSPSMDLLLKRGREAMEAGDLATAIEHFTALTDHAPEFAEGWNARATAYFLNGQFGPSIADIQHTLALNEHHFGALSGLGQIFEALEQEEKAVAAYRAALAIHPHQEGIKQALERLEQKTTGTEL
ncbi:tetratricopeptide repeat protein [Defluviimonas sp. WL0050]|uniref:Tetratricopeptide repeat protein n=1 Tax=Albidovulum litorale TaxID=2984134 RepID=A0ABT2ZJT4_9RHOB|nr:tetratricopeptide repeat protein [Defluviimonas sp. WL0050]